MKKKVFVWVILWMFVTLVAIGAFHFPIINSIEYNQGLSRTENASRALQYEVDHLVKGLELEILGFSKDLESGAKWLDTSLNFLSSNTSIKEVHLFDTNRLHQVAQAQRGEEIILNKNTLEGLFFYQPLIVETYDTEQTIVYFKGPSSYLMLLVDLKTMFDPLLPNSKGMVGVYDQHVVPVITKGESLNGRTFFNHASQNQISSGYTEEVFYSISQVGFLNIPLNILVADLDQTYKKHVRLYMVRYFLLSAVFITVGFLVAWRIVKVFRQSVVTSRLEKITELSDIKKNINLAINHMGMAAKSFDDINVLKEELEALYVDLEEGGKNDFNQESNKEHNKLHK